jgi:hypothetical protein
LKAFSAFASVIVVYPASANLSLNSFPISVPAVIEETIAV